MFVLMQEGHNSFIQDRLETSLTQTFSAH